MRWLLAFTAGCYSPTPPAGSPCGADEVCPIGLTCTGGLCLEPGTTSDGPIADAAIDMMVTPPDGCTTFASQLDTCTVAATGSLVLTANHTYNTTTHELRDVANALVATTHVQVEGPTGPIDLLIVDAFTLQAGTLRVVGEVPFGIVAFGSITIVGTIDASSGGAGARGRTACETAAGGIGTTDAVRSSGGGGGAMRGDGGKGGTGDTNGVPVIGAAGGTKINLPTGVLGGCPGGAGGGGELPRGEGGDGGGAVYLVARTLVAVNGGVNAGGGGGLHGDPMSGSGGGGGSGGVILIEAPSVMISGTLASNGGGGAGGADDADPNGAGEDGESGKLSATSAQHGDGFAPNEGGDGADGAAGNNLDGFDATDQTADNGGGGGGGACGFIAVGAPSKNTVGATVSPNLSAWPNPPQ